MGNGCWRLEAADVVKETTAFLNAQCYTFHQDVYRIQSSQDYWWMNEINWTDATYCHVIHGVVINKRTYHSGHRMVSGSNAFVLRQKKNDQCFWKYTVKLITKPHTVTHDNRIYSTHAHTHTRTRTRTHTRTHTHTHAHAHARTHMCELLSQRVIIIGIPSPTHSFIPGLKPSFSANPSHCSLSFSSSGLTTWIPQTVYCYSWACGRLSELMSAFERTLK